MIIFVQWDKKWKKIFREPSWACNLKAQTCHNFQVELISPLYSKNILKSSSTPKLKHEKLWNIYVKVYQLSASQSTCISQKISFCFVECNTTEIRVFRKKNFSYTKGKFPHSNARWDEENGRSLKCLKRYNFSSREQSEEKIELYWKKKFYILIVL